MATLNALKKAVVLDQDGHEFRAGAVTSSDTSVARIDTDGNGSHWVVGLAGGSVTVSATRSLDNAVTTLEVTVVAATPFAISLGAEVPV